MYGYGLWESRKDLFLLADKSYIVQFWFEFFSDQILKGEI